MHPSGPSADSPIPADKGLSTADALIALRRYWWIVLLGAGLGGAIALVVALRRPDVYRASATLRVSPPIATPAGAGPVGATESAVLATEMELMRSRSLAAVAVRALHLQVRTVPRHGRVRQMLVEPIAMDSTTLPGEYLIGMTSRGWIGVMHRRSRSVVAEFAPDDTLRFAGVTLVLGDGAQSAMPFALQVLSPIEALIAVREGLTAFQPPEDARLAILQYEDTDSALVARVANTLAEGFVNARSAEGATDRQRTIELLARQADTVATQLASAEQELADYRQRNRAVNTGAASGTQVSRLITLQTDRTTLTAERGALARLLEQADRRAARVGGTGPSPYRELLGFPALLRSGAGDDLLAALAEVEHDQPALPGAAGDSLTRARAARRRDVERRLRGIAATYLDGLTAEVRSIDSSMALLDRQLAAVPQQELDLARLERRPKVLRDIQSLLDTRLNEAQLAHQSYAPEVRVLDPAVAPLRPVRPNRTLIVFIGVAAGLVAGAGGALVRRALNPAVRSRRDVRVAVGLPVLGLIPRLAAPPGTLPLVAERARPRPALDPAMPQSVLRVTALRRTAGYTFLGASRGAVQPPELPEPATNGSESVPPPAGHAKRLPGSGRSAPPARVARVAPTEAGQAMAEAYTVFQANLVALRSKPAAKTLLLTSPLAGDGKTTSALNLAVALALRGLRVVLLDADLRRGRVHEAFEAPPEPGLADVLGGRCQLPQALHTLQVGDDHSLDYLTRGKARSHPTGLLDSGAMRELLAALALEYDAVILDSPPANVLTDAAVLGAMVDEVVIVARAGSTDGEALRYAREQLEHVRAPLAGVLLNDIEFAKDIAYDRAYRFHALSDAYLRPKDQG